jgi:hypothetical protein
MVTGYYYSIQGDIYLQRTWNRLKASLSQTQAEKQLVLPAPTETTKKKVRAKTKVKVAAKKKKTKKVQVKKSTKNESQKVKITEKVAPKKVEEEILKVEIKSNKEQHSPVSQSLVKKEKKGTVTKKPIRKRSVFSGRRSTEKPSGSVSDRLQKLSGRSYDVYQERFLAKARGAIRKVLGAGKGLFYVIPEEVEDIVYGFLRDHYSDPYMNWESSEEKKKLETQGFSIDSLDSIIDECYKHLS